MVTYAEVRASNALINDENIPHVAVFVGGTAGVGQLTIKALVATKLSLRIYLVGRKSSAERSNTFIQEMNVINSKAEIVWIEGEISLLAETRRIAGIIRAKEPRIDLLFLSAGYAPYGERTETSEGVVVAQSLEYYSRMLFVQHLLPSLNAANTPRVISVLGGGMERTKIDVEDLDLKKPGNFTMLKGQPLYGQMNTLALDKFADDNPDVTFIHSWPGWVDTGNIWRTFDPQSYMGWFIWLTLYQLVKFFAFTDEESGQRHLYQSTSAQFGGRGIQWDGKPGVNSRNQQANGLFLVNFKNTSGPNARVMPVLREKARQKVWDHTQQIFKPYL